MFWRGATDDDRGARAVAPRALAAEIGRLKSLSSYPWITKVSSQTRRYKSHPGVFFFKYSRAPNLSLTWHRAYQLSRPDGLCIRSAPSLAPQLFGMRDRVDVTQFPPCFLIADGMEFSVVCGTKRHGPFVTDFAAHSARLGITDVVGMAR